VLAQASTEPKKRLTWHPKAKQRPKTITGASVWVGPIERA
jgi:hypothetical protein